MNCENCSIPPGACSNVGQSIQIGAEKRYGDKRAKKVTVWCCSEECAVQAAAISEYGPASFRWPVTLDQFRTLFRRRARTVKETTGPEGELCQHTRQGQALITQYRHPATGSNAAFAANPRRIK